MMGCPLKHINGRINEEVCRNTRRWTVINWTKVGVIKPKSGSMGHREIDRTGWF